MVNNDFIWKEGLKVLKCAGYEIIDSAYGGGLYFRDILLNISFLGGQMDIRLFHMITFCQGDSHPGKNLFYP